MVVEGFAGNTTEIKVRLTNHDASRFGLKLLCSPDLTEETVITYNVGKQQFEIDFEKASTLQTIYRNGPTTLRKGQLKQIVPFPLDEEEALDLNIFVDRSVIEIFVNSRACLLQRVYPTREDSTNFRLFSEDGSVRASQLANERHQPLVNAKPDLIFF